MRAINDMKLWKKITYALKTQGTVNTATTIWNIIYAALRPAFYLWGFTMS